MDQECNLRVELVVNQWNVRCLERKKKMYKRKAKWRMKKKVETVKELVNEMSTHNVTNVIRFYSSSPSFRVISSFFFFLNFFGQRNKEERNKEIVLAITRRKRDEEEEKKKEKMFLSFANNVSMLTLNSL